jgi:hypothetical protein
MSGLSRSPSGRCGDRCRSRSPILPIQRFEAAPAVLDREDRKERKDENTDWVWDVPGVRELYGNGGPDPVHGDAPVKGEGKRRIGFKCSVCGRHYASFMVVANCRHGEDRATPRPHHPTAPRASTPSDFTESDSDGDEIRYGCPERACHRSFKTHKAAVNCAMRHERRRKEKARVDALAKESVTLVRDLREKQRAAASSKPAVVPVVPAPSNFTKPRSPDLSAMALDTILGDMGKGL